MGGSRAARPRRGPRRAFVFAAVVAAHVGLVLVLEIAPRRPSSRASPASLVSTLILPPVPARAAARRGARHVTEPPLIEPLALAPMPTPDMPLPGAARASIDWLAEAGRAAEAATAAPHTRSFGKIPEAPSWLEPSRHAPAHQAGDQYRLEAGEAIVWVSDRCYLISEPPPLGAPDVFARSLGTRMGCQAAPGPPPEELFKDLPTYRKHHPQ